MRERTGLWMGCALVVLGTVATGCQGVLFAEHGEGEGEFVDQPDRLPEAIRRAPGMEACSGLGFARVEDCLNNGLPPAPSIRRSSVRPREAVRPRGELPIDPPSTTARTVPYGGAPMNGAPQTFVLPDHRTSADGRIATDGLSLALFFPENLDYGFQTQPGRSPLGRSMGLDQGMRADGRPGHTRIPEAYFTERMTYGACRPDGSCERGTCNLGQCVTRPTLNTSENWEICSGRDPDMGSGSDPTAGRVMRTCFAADPEGGPGPDECGAGRIAGQCYDANFIFISTALPGASDLSERMEIRSIAVTLFFEGAAVGTQSGGVRVPTNRTPSQWVFLYPTADLTRAEGEQLPCNRDYRVPAPNPSTAPYSITHFYEASLALCNGPSDGIADPLWCHFQDQQHFLPLDQDYIFHRSPTSSHAWSGVRHIEPNAHGEYDSFHALLEPATTADGRVLFIQDYSQGLMYSYNTVAPCDAAGFREFRPISMAYLDPNVNTRYGFARYPVRRTDGEVIPPGETLIGGYPWVDRHGDNLIFPTLEGQNGFRGRWRENEGEGGSWSVRLPNEDGSFTSSGDADVEALMHVPGEGAPIESWNVNNANGTGAVILGSWTRGKMVLLDNGLAQSDWTFSTHAQGFRNHRFGIEIFREEETLVRPAGVALVNSFENIMNQYNVMNPITPFDVVWTASSSQQRNVEIAFDEYMRRGMRVVAHMNAGIGLFERIEDAPANPETQRSTNGFVPAEGRTDLFAYSPILQNASTADSPETGGIATIRLLGGSWLPPVAEGGVQGRGVWLDGVNDHILIDRLPAAVPRFYLGLWIDRRQEDPLLPTTLYRFGDGSSIEIRQGAVRYLRPEGSAHEVALDANAMVNGRYVHLGLAFDVAASGPVMSVWVDGQRRSSVRISQVPRFAPASEPSATTGRMAIGTTEYRTSPSGAPVYPVRAWVDEFRFIDLEPGEFTSSAFTEHACNLALGSMRRAGHGTSVCEQIDFRHNDQVDAEGVGTSLDFPIEAYQTRNCGNSVHQDSGGLPCARAELLGLADRQLVANQHRPDFSDVPFCVTCHMSASDPVAGLRPEALLPFPIDPITGVANMSATTMTDPRRQPMQWLRRMDGRAPRWDEPGSPLVDARLPASWFHGQLDPVILGGTASTSPTRLGPY